MSNVLNHLPIIGGPSDDRIWAAGRWAQDRAIEVPLVFKTRLGEFILSRVLEIKWGGAASEFLTFKPFSALNHFGDPITCLVRGYSVHSRKTGILFWVYPADYYALSETQKKHFTI